MNDLQWNWCPEHELNGLDTGRMIARLDHDRIAIFTVTGLTDELVIGPSADRRPPSGFDVTHVEIQVESRISGIATDGEVLGALEAAASRLWDLRSAEIRSGQTTTGSV